MAIWQLGDAIPRIDPTAFVAPTATLIGDVVVEAGASIWFNAVLRGDYGPPGDRRQKSMASDG